MARIVRQTLPDPPATYDQSYISKLANAVNAFMLQATAEAEEVAARFIMTDPLHIPPDLPGTSGLPTGTIYLKPVPSQGYHAQAASVPSTTSPTWVMAGLGLQFTPTVSTQAQFTMDGQVGNTTNNGETDLSLVYGTGTPPVFGAPIPPGSTMVGEPVRFVATGGANSFVPFSRTALVTGLTPGTTYWIGVAIQCPSGGSILSDVAVTGFGMLGSTAYFLTVVEKTDP